MDGIEVGKAVVGSQGCDELTAVMKLHHAVIFGKNELGVNGRGEGEKREDQQAHGKWV